MSDRPDVKPSDWIEVGDIDCVVCVVREHLDAFGDCEVVFNPKKPTNRDVIWNSGAEEWRFWETGDYGGYAEKYKRLRPFVVQLMQGKK
jgi:hypothetical protein